VSSVLRAALRRRCPPYPPAERPRRRLQTAAPAVRAGEAPRDGGVRSLLFLFGESQSWVPSSPGEREENTGIETRILCASQPGRGRLRRTQHPECFWFHAASLPKEIEVSKKCRSFFLFSISEGRTSDRSDTHITDTRTSTIYFVRHVHSSECARKFVVPKGGGEALRVFDAAR